MNNDHEEAPTVLEGLQELVAAPDTSRRVAEVANQRIESINRGLEYLERRDHRVAFVGQIGIGKSSMIGVLGGLLVGAPPTDRNSLKSNSVLAVGAGGTTVCEVRIRNTTATEAGRVGLSIEPFTVEEMRREIRIFAADEWGRRKSTSSARPDDDRDPTPREIQRVIRNMTGLAERTEVIADGGPKKKRPVDPLDDVIAQHDSAGSLANYLVDKATLLNRTDTEWWWPSDDNAYRDLKRRFDDINHGRTPTAMLPKRITIAVPRALPGLSDDFDVEVIDTRGFDGQLSGRRDIQELLRDDRALIVVCVPFRDAPGESVKSLLGDIVADVEFRPAASRVQLVLMDHGDAEGVNGCDGDREFGQQLKQKECSRALQAHGLETLANDTVITSFDTLKDDPQGLLLIIADRVQGMRTDVSDALSGQVADARAFLDNIENVKLELARNEVDRRLRTALKANIPSGVPMRDPLEGLYASIRSWRYASQVYASCRRNGRYGGMDAFAAVRAGASKAATDWFRPLDMAITGVFKATNHDEEFSEILNHVRLRETHYKEAHIAVIRNYADAVLEEVDNALEDADVWETCADEWGGGSGFKERIIGHLQEWSRSQGQFQAHQDLAPALDLLMKAVGGTAS